MRLWPIAICLFLVGPSFAAITASGDVDPDDPNTWTSSTTAYIGRTDTGNPGLVEVDGGSDLLSQLAYLGYEANTAGTVTIDGAGSTWTNSSSPFYIGRAGDGTITITNGGTVNSSFVSVALSAGSTGEVTVSGIGSTWNSSRSIGVGRSGNGSLSILSGGFVSSDGGEIGYSSSLGSMGQVTVDGAGSMWTNESSLSVGEQSGGNGLLTITNGGVVSNTAGYIAQYSGSSGEVTVDGIGSVWTSAGTYVGERGDGILTITNGGAVNSVGAIIGNFSNSTGIVTVDGADSTWTSNNNLYVGDDGDGTLNIAGGAVVSVADTTRVAYDINATGAINFGAGGGTLTTDSMYFTPSQVSGTGTINTRGILSDTDLVLDGTSGSSLFSFGIPSQDSGLVTLNLDLTNPVDILGTGYREDGSLTIQSGLAVISTVGVVGYDDGSTGEVTVTGENSSWTTGTLTVGREGLGTLAIAAGAAVSSSNAYISSDHDSSGSAVTVDGESSSWMMSGSLYVGDRGDASLSITDGGAVSSSDVYVGSKNGSTSVATVDGATSTWASSGDLYVGEIGDGILNIAGGAAVSAAETTYVDFDGDNLSSINFGAGSGTLTTGSVIVSIPHLSGTGTIDTNGIVSDYDMVLDSSDDLIQTLTFGGSGQDQDVTVHMDLSSPVEASGVNHGSLSIRGLDVSSSKGYVGFYTGSTGAVSVDGEGSTWTISDELYVGEYGNGALAITNGGVVTTSNYAYIGHSQDSTGAVTVDGTGSSWINDGILSIGFDGDGTLEITEGGTVSNTTGSIGSDSNSTGQVMVDGTGSTWTTSTLIAGLRGDGKLAITNGGSVSSEAGYIGYLANGIFSKSTGQVTVDGIGSSWIESGDLYVGYEGDGKLAITRGGVVNSDDGYIAYENESTGLVTVDGVGSTWTISGDLYMGYDVYDEGIGTLTITGGGLVSVAGTLAMGPFENFELFTDDVDANALINLKTGGMLALAGDADGSIYDFLDLVDGTGAIRYWCGECSEWRSIQNAEYDEDYTLEYLTTGDLAGFTLLTVGSTGGLPGDYNGNNIIDAADYTVWRDALTASSTTLLNDPTPGTVDESDFIYWRNNFGEVLGSGSESVSIPEPSSVILLAVGCILFIKRKRPPTR